MSPIERENMQLKERASDVELENATLRARIVELEKIRQEFDEFRTKHQADVNAAPTLRAENESLKSNLEVFMRREDAFSQGMQAELSHAHARIAELEKERDDFHMAYRTKADEETKQLSLEVIRHCKTIDALQARIAELEKELERERMRLAACGTAALGYFDGCLDEYKSASLDDVLRLRSDLAHERELRQATERDAERYRWLRDQDWELRSSIKQFCVVFQEDFETDESLNDHVLDQAIDAAIQASKTDSDQKGEG